MNMEEDKYSELFANFDPDLSSDALFMANLQQKLQTVELVKQRVEIMRQKNRLAMIAASIAGIVSGVISTLAYPTIIETVVGFGKHIPSFATVFNDYSNVISWGVIGSIVLALTFTVYDIALITVKK